MFDLTFYKQDLNGTPAPNDDLDLQLVWLQAADLPAQRTGAR